MKKIIIIICGLLIKGVIGCKRATEKTVLDNQNEKNIIENVEQQDSIILSDPPVDSSQNGLKNWYQFPNSNDTIFEVAEISPSFPGGETTMFEFLAKNLLYPESMIDVCIGGKVICSFVVEIDGSITNIKVVRGVHELLDNEAVRVIKLMPKWIPGRVEGKSVRSLCYLPIIFKME